jgi:hypothetical protein
VHIIGHLNGISNLLVKESWLEAQGVSIVTVKACGNLLKTRRKCEAAERECRERNVLFNDHKIP